jgi:hypothetical protein
VFLISDSPFWQKMLGLENDAATRFMVVLVLYVCVGIGLLVGFIMSFTGRKNALEMQDKFSFLRGRIKYNPVLFYEGVYQGAVFRIFPFFANDNEVPGITVSLRQRSGVSLEARKSPVGFVASVKGPTTDERTKLAFRRYSLLFESWGRIQSLDFRRRVLTADEAFNKDIIVRSFAKNSTGKFLADSAVRDMIRSLLYIRLTHTELRINRKEARLALTCKGLDIPEREIKLILEKLFAIARKCPI